MIVRFSKYDFWIPEQILDFKMFVPEKIILLEMKNIFRKSTEKIVFDFFEKSKNFIENQYTFFEKNPVKNRKIFDFSRIFFKTFD